MTRRYEMRTAAVLITIGLALPTPGIAGEPSHVEEFYESLTGALLDMGMTPEDFSIRYDYAEPDVFRLPLVDSLMHDPQRLLVEMDSLAQELERTPRLQDCALTLWKAMSVNPEVTAPPSAEVPETKDIAGRFVHLEPGFRRALEACLVRLEKMSGLRTRALGGVAADLDFLCDRLPRILGPGPEYEGIDPFELHRLESHEEALTDSVLGMLEHVDMAAVAALSLEALAAAGTAERHMAGLAAPAAASAKRYRGRGASFAGSPFSVTGDVIYMGVTPYGPIVIGDTSRTVYEGCFAVIIDPGGNDVYNLTDDALVPFRMILDCAGDDAYRSTEATGVAGAMMGTSLILDLAGDDSYRSKGISLGAGICGIGAIDDRAGNDSYVSGIFSQGAGLLGLGILKDACGHDTYTAGMQSQAFGYVMGSGLLLDSRGNDTYHTRLSQTDILRYDDHFLSLSQGCAFGSRPDYSGGIGLLVDSGGNDVYSSDIFGQGVAYWFAVGALIDRGGHDRYCSYQYAQGSGVHLAFGLLLDQSGDDGYISKGVSQGCGHDLSLGLLADFSGNDWYTATDLSQGAGSANGTGIIYDADGDDVYAAKSEVNVNGYGDYRREFGSIGLHLDRRGRDYYSARGEDASLWEGGTCGLGEDVPGKALRPGGDIQVNEYPFSPREFTSEELFILSSRGEPRFRQWREYAFERMVQDTLATIAYLRTMLATDDARERHTIKDILRRIGQPAVPMLTDAVMHDAPEAKSEASWIAGLVGSREAFEALLDLSRSESWKLRSSALNAIGNLNDLTAEDRTRLEERIAEVLTDPGEVFYVKKDAAYSAGGQGLCGSLGLLVGALADRHCAVRFSASEAIRDLSKAGCENVAAEIIAGLRDADEVGTTAALRACQDLPVAGKLDAAEAALAARCASKPPVQIAVAKLLAGIAPDTPKAEARLAALRRLTTDSWKTRGFLGSQ
jgi:hypothetical protein